MTNGTKEDTQRMIAYLRGLEWEAQKRRERQARIDDTARRVLAAMATNPIWNTSTWEDMAGPAYDAAEDLEIERERRFKESNS